MTCLARIYRRMYPMKKSDASGKQSNHKSPIRYIFFYQQRGTLSKTEPFRSRFICRMRFWVKETTDITKNKFYFLWRSMFLSDYCWGDLKRSWIFHRKALCKISYRIHKSRQSLTSAFSDKLWSAWWMPTHNKVWSIHFGSKKTIVLDESCTCGVHEKRRMVFFPENCGSLYLNGKVRVWRLWAYDVLIILWLGAIQIYLTL